MDDSKKKSEPIFSILIPSYNQAQFLPMALDSLIMQTYPNWEAVVVNDGSTDATPGVLQHYAYKDQRFRVFHKKNGGCGSALNEALRHARGEWICWLSSDDLFIKNKLEIHLHAFKQYPKIKFFHADYLWLNDTKQQKYPSNINFNQFLPPRELQVIRLFQINYFNGISICINKSVFEDIGFFKEHLRNAQDFDMWLRISSKYQSEFIFQQTSISRIHTMRETNKFPMRGIYDSARACLEFLNEHPFEVLFPLLDLSKKEHLFPALREVINVVANPNSYINLCGYTQALIDRLHEWLVHYCPQDLKAPLEKEFKNIGITVQNSSIPGEIKTALASLCGATYLPFTYQAYDPFKKMIEYAEYLYKSGNNNAAKLIRQYLERVKQFETS